jgi:integrase
MDHQFDDVVQRIVHRSAANLNHVAAPKRRTRGHIRELPPGSFQAIVYAGTDPLTGEPRPLRETAKTYAGAATALTRLQSQVDENRHPKSDITVGQAIAQWLDVATHEDTTRDRYEDLIRIYIGPTLGKVVAGKLDAEILERFYARLQRCRALCDGRPKAGHKCEPLSASTVRKIHYIMSAALDQAVRWRHLDVNPASLTAAPSASRPNPDPPSADEAAAIIGASWRDPEWGLLLWLVMVTGMRRGEISALRWRHVDLRNGVVLIQRANAQPRAGVKEKTTKSQQQRRLALDELTVALLTDHRQRWQERCSALDVPFRDDLFVFSPAPDASRPYQPHSLSQRYRLLATRLKLRSTRLHALRHYSRHRADRRRRRRADRRWQAWPRQRRCDDAEGVHGMGERSGPASGNHDRWHHADTRGEPGAATRTPPSHRRGAARADRTR